MLRHDMLLFFHLAFELAHRVTEFFPIERFQQILPDAEPQRGLCILKICISADHYDLQLPADSPRFLYQLQPVTPGHPDIGNQNIRVLPPQKCQRLQTVSSNSHQLHIECFPIDQCLN